MEFFKNDTIENQRFIVLKSIFIISGVLQGISVMLTIPLFKELFSRNTAGALSWVLYIAVIAALCFVLNYIGVNIGNHMSVWEVCDTKTRALGSAIIKLPLGWFDASSKGKVSKVISSDINTLSHYPPIVLPEILTVVSSSAVIGISLLFISIKYAFVLITMLPIMYYFWRNNIKSLGELESENVLANQKMESVIVEFAQLQPVLRASGVLVNGWNRLDDALIYDRNQSVKTLRKKGRNTFKYMLVVNLATLLILLMSAIELKNSSIELYTFVGIVVAMFRFSNPLSSLIGYMSEMFNIKSALERINSIVCAETLKEATTDVELADNSCFNIEFKDVNFSYIKDTRVIKDLSLKIRANEITALVGASGSGKSTVNKLIARFWDVDSGEILINGVNIKEIKTDKLMSMISMVFQEVYLFNTTIRENVSIANPNASEADLMEAAKKARLDEVIERLPNGWDTVVGEGGGQLSGGEKQRVSVARAFLKNAPILLLDEITSALDGINEAVITSSLEELSRDKTVVVIAHRLSSIKNADNIAVIDSGRLIDFGKHQDLVSSSEKYSAFWSALVSRKEWTL